MIQSVERALSILELFDRRTRELGISEIARSLNLSKSTVHGLVRTLETRGFLSRNPETGRYRLGLKVYELGQCYSVNMELHYAAKTLAQELSERHQQAVNLGIYAGGMVVFVLRFEPHEQLITTGGVGATFPAHATALGKVLLAHLPQAELDSYLARELTSLTRHTITDPERLRSELIAVVEEGYAVDREETLTGIACVAAPIRNHRRQVVAAISLSGSPEYILGANQALIAREVKDTACEVSRLLGCLDD